MARPSATGWAAVLAARPALASEPLLAHWAARGFPLIGRRPLPEDPPGAVPLGLPLPPCHGKTRIAVAMPPQDLQQAAPPPLLAEARLAAPDAWQETITQLLRLDPLTRCFGGLAWQHLTGLAYLSAGSDLDLLWERPGDPAALLAGLAAIGEGAPMRIDGEVLGRDGGVQWRELATADPLVVKGAQDLMLLPRVAFLAGLS
jgi:malonate decarboxylase holo-[acyl-carrier-protein] synthase